MQICLLLFKVLPFSDVTVTAPIAKKSAIIIVYRLTQMPDPTERPIGTPDPEFQTAWLVSFMMVLNKKRQVILVDNFLEQSGIGFKFVGGMAGYSLA